jgi:hypothetical protein
MSRAVRCTTWEHVLAELHGLDHAVRGSGPWALEQILGHCAQSIEYSMTGYPRLRSGLFRATIGRLAKGKFMRQGFMSHGLAAPIAGAPELPAGGDAQPALLRLRQAIETFRAFKGSPRPHLAYGACTKAEYEQLHAMHIADHLSELS